MSRPSSWFRSSARRLWGAAAFVAAAAAATVTLVPAAYLGLASALLSAVAMLALAYPALRRHEQSRTLALIKALDAQAAEQRGALEGQATDSRAHGRALAALEETEARLTGLKDGLLSRLGSWTPLVEGCVVVGYLSFALAVALQLWIAWRDLGAPGG